MSVRISVIIPTYQRCDQVLAAVKALENQSFEGNFEVIVVVDGSTDDTEAILKELATPFPLTILAQPNLGAAAARNTGGFAARGDILLFLDDDMVADPGLLAAHEQSHRSGASIVIGHIPLHPDSPRNLLSALVGRWIARRARRLSAPGADIRVTDLVGGQLSVSCDGFRAAGGFAADLMRGEDVDFGHRVISLGYRAAYNPAAISWQRYTVDARQAFRQWRESGRASVRLARRHPEIAHRFFDRPVNRPLFRLLARIGGLVAPLRWAAIPLVERGYQDRLTARLFFWAQGVEYCRGVREAGGQPQRRPLRVLAYHAIGESSGMGRFARYTVAPDQFRRQIESLRRHGYHFVSASEVVHFLRRSGGLPRRPVLLTFDDCYASVLELALPVLQTHGIPAVAFAVTRRLGGVSDWSRMPGAPELPLLDAEGLQQLSRSGFEIGAHSRTHPPLPAVDEPRLADEVSGSSSDLKALGLGPARLFAYPYGESDRRVQRVVEGAGYQAAFTVRPGLVRPGVDPYDVPRIEILREDAGWKFHWKVVVAGSAHGAINSWRVSSRRASALALAPFRR